MLPSRSLAVLVAALTTASAALALSATPATGQASLATLSGVVLDAEGRTAVEGAEVVVLGANLRALTSPLGEFRFESLRPGFVVLQVSHPGYRSRTDTLGVAPGERVEVRLTVSVAAIELEPINVVARRSTLGTGITGRFPGMTRTEIEKILPRVSNLADLVQNTTVPVRVKYSAMPGERPAYCVEHPRVRTGRFEGSQSGTCLTMNVYVDGRLQVDPLYALADIPPDNIERFEVLSPLDATTLYGDAGHWGVILVETRSGTGVTERRLPVYARDDAPFSFAITMIGSSPNDVYDGEAVVTYQQLITTTRYTERTSWRPGLRVAARARPFGWFPELELSGFLLSGSSEASFLGAGVAFEQHSFRTVGLELAARPRLTRGPSWDLSFLAGPVIAWERFAVERAGVFAAAPGLGELIAGHMDRTWATIGAVVGADFEYVVHPRASVLVGGRWRGLTLGQPGADITQAQAQSGADAFQLPQAKNRAGRRSLEVGLSVRTGGS
ncbi:MAG: carboxypeptidase regulatory-like domain-containing protein [Gemmatimonadota bacterium]